MPLTVAQTAPAFTDSPSDAFAASCLSVNVALRAEYEDQRILLPPLPPVAPDFVEELLGVKNVEIRGLFEQLDDEWTRRALLPPAPNVLEDWTWNKDFSALYVKPVDAESIDFARPIFTRLAYDETDWQRRCEWLFAPQTTEQDLPSQPPNPPAAFDDGEGSRDFTEKRYWHDGDVLLGIPAVPSTGWMEETAAVMVNTGSLAAMVMMDEFVNAPSGGNTFGNAPRGRSSRFGFSISAFR